jgi:hypothetical protein
MRRDLHCRQEHQRNLESAMHEDPLSIISLGRTSETHDDVVTSSFSEHVGDQLGGNRGSGLVFLVLTSVGEMGKDSGDSTS